MERYRVNLTLVEPLLGTVPKSKQVYKDHVQGRAAELGDEAAAEELETIQAVEEKGWTGFHMDDGIPILYDYVIRGFLKSACGALRRVSGTRSAKLQAYKKVIDGLVFVEPRRIPLSINGGEMGVLERPLRAQTAKGERVALARSDTCPVGTTMEFELLVLGVVSKVLLEEWFSYGALMGLGQWRSGGYGRFVYYLAKVGEA
jgi:hypothetical protein